MPQHISEEILADIPDESTIRRRLAIITTEADLLRSQLRVSKRVQRERERLRELMKESKDGKG